MGFEVFMDKDGMNGRTLGGKALEAYHKARKHGQSHDVAEQVAENVARATKQDDGVLNTSIAVIGGPGNIVY